MAELKLGPVMGTLGGGALTASGQHFDSDPGWREVGRFRVADADSEVVGVCGFAVAPGTSGSWTNPRPSFRIRSDSGSTSYDVTVSRSNGIMMVSGEATEAGVWVAEIDSADSGREEHYVAFCMAAAFKATLE